MVALKGVVDSRATLRTRPTNAGAVARFEYQVTLQSVRLLLFFFLKRKASSWLYGVSRIVAQRDVANLFQCQPSLFTHRKEKIKKRKKITEGKFFPQGRKKAPTLIDGMNANALHLPCPPLLVQDCVLLAPPFRIIPHACFPSTEEVMVEAKQTENVCQYTEGCLFFGGGVPGSK